jgi:hypothetical protein
VITAEALAEERMVVDAIADDELFEKAPVSEDTVVIGEVSATIIVVVETGTEAEPGSVIVETDVLSDVKEEVPIVEVVGAAMTNAEDSNPSGVETAAGAVELELELELELKPDKELELGLELEAEVTELVTGIENVKSTSVLAVKLDTGTEEVDITTTSVLVLVLVETGEGEAA